MGLFDDYVDPQQFGSGGGLLGRLLALQRIPDQDQQGASFQTGPSTPGFQNDALAAYSGPGNIATSRMFGKMGDLTAPKPVPNTHVAQYSPVGPAGIPLPPLFIPETPENDAFVRSTIGAGRAIGDAVGNILNSENNENPVPGTTPGPETKGRSKIFQKPGTYDDAVKDFNDLNPANVRPLPKGGLTGTLPDGRDVNVRPDSSDGNRPTIEIIDGKNRVKTRYGDKP